MMKYLVEESNKIDLHIHTEHSDGIFYHREILEKAKELGLHTIAFTDHNIDEISSAKLKKIIYNKFKLNVISGCELDVSLDGERVHVLAYKYNSFFNKIIIPKLLEQYNKYQKMPKFEKVCKLIKLCGGKAILAHPFKYDIDGKLIIEKVLKKKCIDGIECIHPYHTQEEIDYLLNVCDKNNLIVSAGSDFHFIGRETRDDKPQMELSHLPATDSTIEEQLIKAKQKYPMTKR